MWEKLIQELKKEVEEYKRVTNKRLNKIHQVLGEIEEIFEEAGISRMKVSVNGREYILHWYKSNVGAWFTLSRFYPSYGSRFALPTTIDEADRTIYLHGDFHAKIYMMDREEILEAIKDFPEIINKVYEEIRKYREEVEKNQ